MAVGLTEAEEILPVAGIKLAAVTAGIKKNKQPDMVVIAIDNAIDNAASCAATFTRNAFCAAPVTVAKQNLAKQNPLQNNPLQKDPAQQNPTELKAEQKGIRALLINSGNANAGTGSAGMDNARQSCQWLAEELQCLPEQILPFSTGVIGEQLPMKAVHSGIKQIAQNLSADNWLPAARGIMTTDTLYKAVSRKVSIDDIEITISGIAKGSGMICPNMATMLAFITTDARIEQAFLQQCLSAAVDKSFNSITVDGDTSTNDACVLVASGKADNTLLDEEAAQADVFIEALQDVCRFLAQAIIRDGEGATKFVTVSVTQALTEAEAKQVAYTIAHSPLVKTALFASDPNWGRILAAVGRAGLEQLDIAGVNLYLDDVCIVSKGGIDAGYSEERGQAVMDRSEITILVELGRGNDSATVWTSDLSHEYVRINAEYRS